MGDHMKYGEAAYVATRDAMVEVLRGWAREGRTDTYKKLSETLAPEHRVHYHGSMMSRLLADVCRQDSTGPDPMLSALVVNGTNRKPSGQFFELAVTEFHRRDPNWTWEQERDAVFARYRRPASL
ncbi:hypothetical protein [Streptomyces sp. ICBB 8177]|uniref:hypothetical protein n=1 Tax=Streptomyces sp. ICBB 8177 TaxID=563922 RepID=UPI000D6787F8|nr:hypothetical protein [Streptomyces sp. ICBB 8177]PWI45374.1 hypothetical protein CK485_04350 [Streptomyces sp. ICBB 8177]